MVQEGEYGPRRAAPVQVRLLPSGLEWIDAQAVREQRSRSAMVRILLGEAIDARRKKAPQPR